jgi:hypothetical protein
MEVERERDTVHVVPCAAHGSIHRITADEIIRSLKGESSYSTTATAARSTITDQLLLD